MLRRTPSGAQKKIRQRAESQRAKDEAGYRQVLDSGSYRSILPPGPFNSLPRFNASSSSSQSSPPQAVSSPISPNTLATASPFVGKPTVQVAPMPMEPLICPLPLSPKEKAPPLVKEEDSGDKKPSRGEKPVIPRKPTALGGRPLAASNESLNGGGALFASPSLLSLQAAFQDAQQLSADQLVNLENRRQQLVDSLSKKIEILDEERRFLEQEAQGNAHLGHSISTMLNNVDKQFNERLVTVVLRCKEAIALELKLKTQLTRATRLQETTDVPEEVNEKRHRLEQQAAEAGHLRATLERRAHSMRQRLEEHVCRELAPEWGHFLETDLRLAQQLAEIDEQLQLGRRQLDALHKIARDS